MRKFLTSTIAVVAVGIAMATTPTIDGLNIAADFAGPAIAVQDTNTQFGNNQNELCQMFLTGDLDNMYLGLTGNLDDNNALLIFVDVDPAAGPGTILNTDPGGACPSNVPTVVRMLSGTKFDDDFHPDYCLSVSVGKFPGHSDYQLVDACDLTDLNTIVSLNLGIGVLTSRPGQPRPEGAGLLTGNSGVRIAIDNRNDLGVGDYGISPTPAPGEPESALSGIEIAIPKALLGLHANHAVRLFAYVSNNAQGGGGGPCFRQGYGSNQALPGLGGVANLGSYEPGFLPLDFTIQAAGNQWVDATIP
ncbi:MAG: hypothetical protein HZB38_15050 [Planctomycetes bacterium]|nr:hypothetical protein [Planctomycetota bacterium]